MTPSKIEALAGLRDIHLPDPVGLWPPAPGWWLALALLLAVAVVVWLVARRRNTRRAALRELAGAARDFERSANHVVLAVNVSALLRRVALRSYDPRYVASLHGCRWVEFLDSTGMPSFVGAAIEHSLYAGADSDVEAASARRWIDAARHWIRGNT